MNSLQWCQRCKEQRKEWEMRIFSGGAYWLYSTSTWERMPDDYNPWTPSKYGHLFPKVESIDEVDYTRDDFNRRGDVNLARLKVKLAIKTRELVTVTPKTGSYQLGVDAIVAQMNHYLDSVTVSMNNPGNAYDVIDDVLLINGIPTNKENQ